MPKIGVDHCLVAEQYLPGDYNSNEIEKKSKQSQASRQKTGLFT